MSDAIQRIEESLSQGNRVSTTDIRDVIAGEDAASFVVSDVDGQYTVYTIHLPSGKSVTFRE